VFRFQILCVADYLLEEFVLLASDQCFVDFPLLAFSDSDFVQLIALHNIVTVLPANGDHDTIDAGIDVYVVGEVTDPAEHLPLRDLLLNGTEICQTAADWRYNSNTRRGLTRVDVVKDIILQHSVVVTSMNGDYYTFFVRYNLDVITKGADAAEDIPGAHTL
jgi:hypothetical protein